MENVVDLVAPLSIKFLSSEPPSMGGQTVSTTFLLHLLHLHELAPLVFLSPSIFQTVHKTVIRNVSTSVYAPRVSLVKLIKDRSRKPCYAVVTYCCRDLRLRNCTTISRLILYNSQLKLIINVELILMRKYLKIDFKIEY